MGVCRQFDFHHGCYQKNYHATFVYSSRPVHSFSHFRKHFEQHKNSKFASMQKTLSIALLLFGAVLATTFAAEQELTKGTLVIGSSQHLAEGTLCMEGQSSCYGLRKLKEEKGAMRDLERSSGSGVITPVNETSGNPEIVCFDGFARCYQYRRLQQDVFAEHRRLEVTGDSELKHVGCFNQQGGLHCN